LKYGLEQPNWNIYARLFKNIVRSQLD